MNLLIGFIFTILIIMVHNHTHAIDKVTRGDTSNTQIISKQVSMADTAILFDYYGLEGPILDNGINSHLYIPRIDTFEESGKYTNAYLNYDKNLDAWKLERVHEFSINHDLVREVELVVTKNFPVQVFLVIKNNLETKSGVCSFLSLKSSKISQIQKANTFQVIFNATKLGYVSKDENIECKEGTTVLAYPLNVFGLKAGIYNYIVNDTHRGSFELKEDNVLTYPFSE